MSKLGIWFDRATSVALLGAVLLFGYVAFSRQDAGRQLEASPLVGTTAPPLVGVDYRNGPTLLLVLSSQCRYCLDSIPFYRRLAKARMSGARVQVVAGSAEPADVFRAYLEREQVTVDARVVLDRRSWAGIRGTPSIVMINQNGRIREVWQGLLAADQEQELARTVGLTLPE